MTFDSDRTGQAFGLVLAAAGATALGCLAVFFPSLAKFATAKVLGASLGFATGVMLYVSLVEIYGKAQDGFEDAGHSEDDAFIYTTLTFFGGILGMKASLRLCCVLPRPRFHRPAASGFLIN